ncbi:MAG: GGDEF domain-containing protein, partial [Pseudomonadota bacterium]|nr:GGDEF domain-containing protein [Pseudomonadota bacterium]
DHDELSKALNRRAFMRELALFFVSIENLKDINDRYGHGVGDAMVEHSADVMLYHLGKADVVGRLGGAEFAIVLVGAGEAVASEKAVWLGKLLMNQLLIQGGLEVPQVVSIAARPLDPTEEPEAALATSDRDASP